MTVYLVISLPDIPYIHRMYGSGQPYTFVTDKFSNVADRVYAFATKLPQDPVRKA